MYQLVTWRMLYVGSILQQFGLLFYQHFVYIDADLVTDSCPVVLVLAI